MDAFPAPLMPMPPKAPATNVLARRNTLIQMQLLQFETKQLAKEQELTKRIAEKNIIAAKLTVQNKWKSIMFIIITLKRIVDLITKYRKSRKGAYV